MLRTDLIASINSVVKAVEESGLINSFSMFTKVSNATDRTNTTLPLLIKSFDIWRGFVSGFTDEENQLIKIMGVGETCDVSWWTKLIVSGSTVDRPRELMVEVLDARLAFRSIVDQLPKIALLLHRDSDPDIDQLLFEMRENKTGDDRIRLILPEESGTTSSPERVVKGIEAVSSFYEAISRIENTSMNDLAVASCDSGSDKNIDFTGLSGTTKQVKLIFFQILDLSVFYRERKASEQLELIKAGLPIIANVASMVAENKIDAQQAELVKRAVFKGIGCVLETGARIPEMNDGIIIDINKILPAQPRLLLPAAKPTEAKQVEPDDALDEAEATSKGFVEIDRQSPSTGDLTSEQRKEFEEFLRFKRDKNDGKSEASDTE